MEINNTHTGIIHIRKEMTYTLMGITYSRMEINNTHTGMTHIRKEMTCTLTGIIYSRMGINHFLTGMINVFVLMMFRCICFILRPRVRL